LILETKYLVCLRARVGLYTTAKNKLLKQADREKINHKTFCFLVES